MKKKFNTRKGFTLVEMLIYIACFVLLIGAIVSSLLLFSSSYRNIKAIRELERGAVSSINQIVRDSRNAIRIDGANTSYNNANGSLQIVLPDNSTERFYLSNGVVMLDQNGVSVGALTSNKISVTSLVFRPITASNSDGVKIEMTVRATSTNDFSITKNFYNTVVLRGSYD